MLTSKRNTMMILAFLGIAAPLTPLALAQSPAPQPTTTRESGATANSVAAQVQAFYDQTRTVQATFKQAYTNRLYKRTDRSSGRVVFAKPGKMRWDYAQPNGKIIVSDGSKMVIYEPAERQYFEQPMTESQLPQALSFLTGTGKLADNFTFALLSSTEYRFAGHVLELRPKQPSTTYDRILFYVDATTARPGLVHRVLIIDHSGNRNQFDFRYGRGAFNGDVNTGMFNWTPPAGTRRIQP